MKNLFLIIAGLLFTVNILSQETWSLTGNANTNSSANFIGTTDNAPLIFRVNNQRAGFTGFQDKNNVSFGHLALTNSLGNGNANSAFGAQALQWGGNSIMGNVAIGTWALEWCTSGDNNTAVGVSAMANSMAVGNHNVAIGQKALFNNNQSGNTAVGSEAGFSNTTGEGLTAVGFRALANNSTGEFNTALGYRALSYNTTGHWNVALGSGSLQYNSTGRFNTAGGNSSLHFNKTGVENTAFGEQALAGSIDGNYNTAVGCRAMWSVIVNPGEGDTGYGHGESNTALGYESLREITTGSWNVGVGVRSLLLNSSGKDNVGVGGYTLGVNKTGDYNIAIGSSALGSNTTGNENTALGSHALFSNATGSQNTAIGYGADVSYDNLTNATAIGYGARATASNQVTIGNSSVTMIRGFAPWTTVSDGRVKENVQENVPGLSFINKLRPVTYNLDMDAADNIIQASSAQNGNVNESLKEIISTERIIRAAKQERMRTGFIAQEVEDAAESIGYDFSGVNVDKSEGGLYGLSYSKFIVPLVKAVQELSELAEWKDTKIEESINSLQEQMNVLTELLNRLLENNPDYTSNPKKVAISDVSLEQNFPNPYNQSTTINYTLPSSFHAAKIVISDTNGRIFMQMPISAPGKGNLTIEASSFPVGIYFYSLFVDNSLVDTKKMIITK